MNKEDNPMEEIHRAAKMGELFALGIIWILMILVFTFSGCFVS
jgi:hypothetical protein